MKTVSNETLFKICLKKCYKSYNLLQTFVTLKSLDTLGVSAKKWQMLQKFGNIKYIYTHTQKYRST